MKATAETVEVVRTLSPSEVPIGEYRGTWGAYNVEFYVNRERYRLRTNVGIRTMNAPCVVIADGATVTIEAL